MEACRHMLTDYQKVRIVELYASGESTRKIGRLLQLSPTTVNRQLHRFGVTLRESRETSTRCQVRHDAFDEISQDAAYWIGFLFADGSVSSHGQTGRVSVRVSERDRNQTCKVSHFPRLHPQGRQCAGRQLRRLPLETLGADQHPIGTAIPATPVPRPLPRPN